MPSYAEIVHFGLIFKGKGTPNQPKFSMFVLDFKVIKTFLNNNTCILK